jgi:hypothetical protein
METEMLSRKKLRRFLKYEDAIIKIQQMWNMKAKVTTVITEATGTISE